MPRYKESFSLYARKTKNGTPVYYYRTYDEESRRTSGVSTGMNTEHAARQYCLKLYKAGKLVPKRIVTFNDYTEDFWVWGKCRYILDRNTFGSKKNNISQEHARTERGYLVNHIRLYFGKKKLTSIQKKDVKDFLIHLKQTTDLKEGTLNHILKIVKIIFNQALEDNLIYENPAKTISYMDANHQKRGILTIEEVRELFDKSRIDEIWDGCAVAYTMNIFAATTGVRRGEILALQNRYLHSEYVEIIHSWGVITGIKDTTKTGISRYVPIRPSVSSILHSIRKGGPNEFLFSLKEGKKHYPENDILPKLYTALERIGISKDERETRRIKFHSWRHFFNTLCLAQNLSYAKVQAVTGHKTKEMTDHYTSFRIEDYREVMDVQGLVV